MSDPTDIPWYTSLDLEMFDNLVEQCSDHLKMTTEKGKERLKFNSAVLIPVRTFIFMTLFWLCFYPTLDLLLILFKIHPRTCTTVLKRTTVALKEEVKFPSDTEMENLKEASFQNFAFRDCVCIINSTEVQISRPKNKELQSKTWSRKKKQNSLNVLMITKLNGKIIY